MTEDRFFTNASEFSIYIEGLASKNDLTIIETLAEYCEETGAEYSDVALLISPTLKQKIYEEATKAYSMPKMTAVQLDDF
jgi:hypothetical protein